VRASERASESARVSVWVSVCVSVWVCEWVCVRVSEWERAHARVKLNFGLWFSGSIHYIFVKICWAPIQHVLRHVFFEGGGHFSHLMYHTFIMNLQKYEK
jgi:hypothetical protein